VEEATVVDEMTILETIQALARQRSALYVEAGRGSRQFDLGRLRQLEIELERSWELLRVHRARRRARSGAVDAHDPAAVGQLRTALAMAEGP
jgi:hypothetical protein